MGVLALASVLLGVATGQEPVADHAAAAHAILAERCVECHGPKKQKGKLRLDTAAGIAAVVKPGAPLDSELYRRAALPADDDDAMPPDEGLDAASLQVLRDWITAGAGAAPPSPAAAAAAARQAQLTALRQATSALVVELDEGGLLRVDFARRPQPPTAAELAALAPFAGAIAELSLAGLRPVAPVLAALPALPALLRLDLQRSDADDAAVLAFAPKATALRRCNLHGTAVTAGLAPVLARWPELRRLLLHGTAAAAAPVWSAAHPDLLVSGDLPLPDDPFGGGGPRRLLALTADRAHLVLFRETALRHWQEQWRAEVRSAKGLVLLPAGPDGPLRVAVDEGAGPWRTFGLLRGEPLAPAVAVAVPERPPAPDAEVLAALGCGAAVWWQACAADRVVAAPLREGSALQLLRLDAQGAVRWRLPAPTACGPRMDLAVLIEDPDDA